MAELGKRVGIFLIGNLLFWGVTSGINNMIDGKTFFGKKKKEKTEKTYVDWKGNVHLGQMDYQVC